MRSLISLIVFLTCSATALADTPSSSEVSGAYTSLALPDDTQLSEACQSLARIPSDAVVDTVVLAAGLSTAMCLAEHRFAALDLRDDDASTVALIHAALPVAELLDQVSNSGNLEYRILAARLGGNLLTSMATRMRMTVHGGKASKLAARREVIEKKIGPWLEGAAVSYADVVELTASHSGLMNNPVIASAARDSARSLQAIGAMQVATARIPSSSQL